jgi:imidazole glycerol-phosphate synthase subunit HisF
MFRPRIIPVLLLKGDGLVKTVKFKNPVYLGDPINAVRIFNDLKADELVFLDIVASKQGRMISRDLIKKIGDEAYMPFSVGGGITTVEQVKEIFSLGAEKVILNTAIAQNQDLIKSSAKQFGNQSIIASIDVKRGIFGAFNIYTKSGTSKLSIKLVDYLLSLENAGAGEILINSIDRDGTYLGYDLDLIKLVSDYVSIPVIACGGASSLTDMRAAFKTGGASACAAGSLFVFHGSRRGVLINYPEREEIKNIFRDAI